MLKPITFILTCLCFKNNGRIYKKCRFFCEKTNIFGTRFATYIYSGVCGGENDMLEKFEALLDEKVRPSLQAHGGDVVIKSYEDGVLKVKLIGKCSGCPSAHDTNEELIAAEVMEAFPEVKDVILVEEVSEDLLAFARKILNHEV